MLVKLFVFFTFWITCDADIDAIMHIKMRTVYVHRIAYFKCQVLFNSGPQKRTHGNTEKHTRNAKERGNAKRIKKFTINNGPLSNPSSFPCLSVSKSMLNNTTYGLKPIKSMRTDVRELIFPNLNRARKRFRFNFSFNLCHRTGFPCGSQTNAKTPHTIRIESLSALHFQLAPFAWHVTTVFIQNIKGRHQKKGTVHTHLHRRFLVLFSQICGLLKHFLYTNDFYNSLRSEHKVRR